MCLHLDHSNRDRLGGYNQNRAMSRIYRIMPAFSFTVGGGAIKESVITETESVGEGRYGQEVVLGKDKWVEETVGHERHYKVTAQVAYAPATQQQGDHVRILSVVVEGIQMAETAEVDVSTPYLTAQDVINMAVIESSLKIGEEDGKNLPNLWNWGQAT